MTDTPVSLLERLHRQPEGQHWQRLVELYSPLIRRWLQQYAGPVQDLDDLLQEILAVLVREVPRFEHNNRQGAFRRWLRTVTVHRVRTYWDSRRHQDAVQSSTVRPGTRRKSRRLRLNKVESVTSATLAIRKSMVCRRGHLGSPL